jgi:uncharacterized protein YbcI
MISLTKEAIEASVAETVSRYHREQHGCAPHECTAYLVADMLVVKSCAVFTPTEEQLAATDDGRKFIKSSRRDLRSITRRDIEGRIADIVRCRVLRSFWDMDVRNGDQVEVYILAENIGRRQSR